MPNTSDWEETVPTTRISNTTQTCWENDSYCVAIRNHSYVRHSIKHSNSLEMHDFTKPRPNLIIMLCYNSLPNILISNTNLEMFWPNIGIFVWRFNPHQVYLCLPWEFLNVLFLYVTNALTATMSLLVGRALTRKGFTDVVIALFCPWMSTDSRFKLPNGELFNPHFWADCSTQGVVYLMTCKCGAFYVGKTIRQLRQRINDHIYYSTNGKMLTPISRHLDLYHRFNTSLGEATGIKEYCNRKLNG